MSSLDNLNKFTLAHSSIDIGRSKFKMPHSRKTTLQAGRLVPIDCIEVLPGDSFKISMSSVVRSITPAVPVMDDAFIDCYAFFVPNRIATKHPKDWEKIMGENVNGYWAPVTESTLFSTGNTFNLKGLTNNALSIANMYGLPIGQIGQSSSPDINVSILPFNGYFSIWNEWFRDENTQTPIAWQTYTQSNYSSILGADSLLMTNKFHDYFTSALPAPQKGQAVLLPLGDFAPVYTRSDDVQNSTQPLRFYTSTGNYAPAGKPNIDSNGYLHDDASGLASSPGQNIAPSNLWADLSVATAATITQLRQAFAIQRLLEKDARGGSRYRELLKVHFGQTIPDSTIQIPQYLGGKRWNVNIVPVLQTSSSDNVSPLGATGAFSNTANSDFLFDKSFTEHGYIHILVTIRNNQSYSQGIPRHFWRNRRYDWYFPVFANLSEQPVFTRELFADSSLGASISLDRVFGYQEAWAELRYLPNTVTGALADPNDGYFNPWTYRNRFSAAPVLNADFMQNPASQIGQTLLDTNTKNQFIGDFYFDTVATRAMPVRSIPGLIDHH